MVPIIFWVHSVDRGHHKIKMFRFELLKALRYTT